MATTITILAAEAQQASRPARVGFVWGNPDPASPMRGEVASAPVACPKNDAIVEELEEFAAAARGAGRPETGGERATASLAVIRAGIVSAKEDRRVTVAEVLG